MYIIGPLAASGEKNKNVTEVFYMAREKNEELICCVLSDTHNVFLILFLGAAALTPETFFPLLVGLFFYFSVKLFH